jgi:nucleoid DNA-binding protein
MEILNNYLFQHRSISIPGLGTLYMERIPARTDFVNRQLLPPAFTFRFDKYFDAPDKDFFGYLASKQHLPDFEVMKWYNEFAYELRTRIRNREEAVWEGLGVFQADENGDIFFVPDQRKSPSIHPVPAVRILRENSEHHLLVGDMERTNTEMPELLTEVHVERESWWTYALIIAAVALTICCFQLFRNGMKFSAIGNQQSVPERNMPSSSR